MPCVTALRRPPCVPRDPRLLLLLLLLLLLKIEPAKACAGVVRFPACLHDPPIHLVIPMHGERGAPTLRYRPASRRGGPSRGMSGSLSAVGRVLCASRSPCACVPQLNLRDRKMKTLNYRTSRCLRGSAKWDGVRR